MDTTHYMHKEDTSKATTSPTRSRTTTSVAAGPNAEDLILQGNNSRVALHKKTRDCTRIFKEFNDWMGIITHRNQVLEEVHTKIYVLNEEFAVTMDPIE